MRGPGTHTVLTMSLRRDLPPVASGVFQKLQDTTMRSLSQLVESAVLRALTF